MLGHYSNFWPVNNKEHNFLAQYVLLILHKMNVGQGREGKAITLSKEQHRSNFHMRIVFLQDQMIVMKRTLLHTEEE